MPAYKPRNPLPSTTLITCCECGKQFPISFYYESHCTYFANGHLPICPYCIRDLVPKDDLTSMCKFCQWADWPFYPERWAKLRQNTNHVDDYYHINVLNTVGEYAATVDWSTLNDKWTAMQNSGELESLSPQKQQEEEKRLRDFWEFGAETQYNMDELRYLDKLYNDIERTQNVGTGTQTDQAKKLARLSLDMDIAQRQNQLDLYAKLMKAYVDLIKIAEFTPKSATSSTSFETIGELIMFLEKTGFINRFYDGEERDIVDKTIKNQQMFLRRIVTGDSTLSERVEQRLQRMNLLDKLEDGISPEEEWSYDLESDDDWCDNSYEDYDTSEEEEDLDVL